MAKVTTKWDVVKNILANNRVKSFIWRTGMMVLAVIIQQLIDLIPGLSLNPSVTVVLGLVLGECSKALNNILSATAYKS